MKYKRFEIKLGERVGRPECTYLKRWYFETPWWSIRLHHWLAGDDPRYLHDHPWNFWTIVLWGKIYETTRFGPNTSRTLLDGFQWFNARYFHTVSVVKPTWTLMITGPKTRYWGFLVDDKWMKSNKFFFTHDLHECE